MNINPFYKFDPYKLVYSVILILTICSGILIAVFLDNGQPGRIDALSSGPYVVERFDDSVQLFAMPDEDAWTADIGYAQRYGTLVQAQIARDRIGAGHVVIVREAIR